MNLDQIVGKLIKERRNKLSYSLQYVGEKIGRSRYTVRDYEEGDSKMSWSIYLSVCSVLDINPMVLADQVQAIFNALPPDQRD